MIKKQIILFGLLFLLSNQSSFSQSYVPATFVMKNGERLKGVIQDQHWSRNPNRIKFKTTEDSESVDLLTTNIVEARVNGERYLRTEVEVELSSVASIYLEYNSDLKLKKDTAFVLVLVEGEKSLYYYKPRRSRANFYIKTEKGIELLKHKRYVLMNKEGRVIKNKNIYIGQLNDYLGGCSRISKKAQKLKYEKNALLSIFKSYYKCTKTSSPVSESEKLNRSEFGIIVGVSATKLNFQSRGGEFFFIDTDFKRSYKPTAGLYFDIGFPKIEGKWSSYNELLFSYYSVVGTHLASDSSNNMISRTAKVSRSYIKANCLIRYKKTAGKVSIFINGGFSFGFRITSKNEVVHNSSPASLVRFPDRLFSRNIERSTILGAGVKYKKISLSLRAEFGNGVSRNRLITTSTHRFFILGGYSF